jgi:hypothetical protein
MISPDVGTPRDPPSQKSFCISTMIKADVIFIIIGNLNMN